MVQNTFPLEESSLGKQHIVLKNVVGKTWTFPIDNVKVGLNIYQPNSFKGKMIKRVLPYIVKMQFVLDKLHIQIVNMRLQEDVMHYLKSLFGIQMEYSIFYGTPSPNQKVTMQINIGKKCIAYVKLSDKEHIAKYFEQEYNLLKSLLEKGMTGIPEAIALKKIGKSWLFVQSGNKVGNEKEAVSFGSMHFDFLNKMYEKTIQNISFDNTLYAENIKELQNDIGELGEREQIIIQQSIKKVICYFTNVSQFYLYHGDFTPWNMYIKENKLNVFDFEYAKAEYPKYLDVFHFHTQMWNLVQHSSKEQIWDLYQNNRQKWKEYLKIENVDIYYIAYLLDIIHENLILENTTNKKIDGSCYELWLYLLERLNG